MLVDSASRRATGSGRAIARFFDHPRRDRRARPYQCRQEALRHSPAFDVRATILEVIQQRDPDLVALSTRGVGFGQRLLYAAVAAAVAHHASCSVLTVIAGSPEVEAETSDLSARLP